MDNENLYEFNNADSVLKQIEELFIPSSVNALLQRDANYEQEKKS